jgi:hypothetical protein
VRARAESDLLRSNCPLTNNADRELCRRFYGAELGCSECEMTDTDRRFSWADDACLHVWPPEHPSPMHAGSLAECVASAIEIADGNPQPTKVEISHGRLGLLQIDAIRALAADPSFPVSMPDNITIKDFELGPMG